MLVKHLVPNVFLVLFVQPQTYFLHYVICHGTRKDKHKDYRYCLMTCVYFFSDQTIFSAPKNETRKVELLCLFILFFYCEKLRNELPTYILEVPFLGYVEFVE